MEGQSGAEFVLQFRQDMRVIWHQPSNRSVEYFSCKERNKRRGKKKALLAITKKVNNK